jgi:hypothetical protein
LLVFFHRYDQALEDYTAADDLFTQQRSPDRALDARANRYIQLTLESVYTENQCKFYRFIISIVYLAFYVRTACMREGTQYASTDSDGIRNNAYSCTATTGLLLLLLLLLLPLFTLQSVSNV